MQFSRSNADGGRRCARWRTPAACLSLGLLLFAGAAAPGQAADWPAMSMLRGTFSGAPTRWEGFYVGGTYSYTSMEANFSDAVSSLSSYGIALSNQTARGNSYGGFVGYNMDWESQLVLGIEGDYHHMTSALIVSNSDQATSGSTTYNASSSVTLKDYGTLRGRVGYAIGRFLPYAQVGLAVGRLSYTTTGTSTISGTTTTILGESNSDAWRAGVAAGVGADLALTSNIFLRGEYEYIAFGRVGEILTSLNSVRAGLGVRF